MITAISIGMPVVDRLTAQWRLGKIHSVFERAVNWEEEDGNFCCLIASGYGNIPCGAVVDTESLCSSSLHPGDRILLSQRQFWVPSRRWAVALGDAKVYEPRRTIDAARFVAGVDEHCHAAVKRLTEGANDEGLLPLLPFVSSILQGDTDAIPELSHLCQAAIPKIVGLIRAARRQDRVAFIDQSRRLLGLGIGMTPSGDDVLVGMLGALSMLRSPLMTESLAAAVADEAQRKTTRISAVYLTYAARGMVGERLSEFIETLSTGSTAETIRTAGLMTSIGSTSGREMALGAILGMYSQ